MAFGDIEEAMHSYQHRHGTATGQQPAHVKIKSSGVLCGGGTLTTHVARATAKSCPDSLGKEIG